jgi:hypothetical protein
MHQSKKLGHPEFASMGLALVATPLRDALAPSEER